MQTKTQAEENEKKPLPAEAPERIKGDISFEIGFGPNKTRFDLRFITIAEENDTAQRFVEVADMDPKRKAEAEYNICKQALTEFAANGETADAIQDNFKEYNPRNERIIRSAYGNFRDALTPDISFL